MPRQGVLAVAIAVALFGSACGGDQSSASADEGSQAEWIVRDDNGYIYDPVTSGRVSRIIGLSSTNSDIVEDRTRQEYFEIQDAIRKCMQREGFNYEPLPAPNSTAFAATSPTAELDFATEYGFGISLQDPELIVVNDPNQASLNSLTEAEGERWLTALYGPIDGAVGEGCETAARASVRTINDQLAAYADVLYEIETAITQSSAVLAAEDAWTDCMVGRGFQIQSRRDIYEQFAARVDSFGEPDESNPDFIQLQADEVDTAVHAFECDQQVRPQLGEAVWAVESTFVDSYNDTWLLLQRELNLSE